MCMVVLFIDNISGMLNCLVRMQNKNKTRKQKIIEFEVIWTVSDCVLLKCVCVSVLLEAGKQKL